MPDLGRALQTALQAVALARQMLLAECARPGGPRGEIGHCPADDEAEWAMRELLLGAFPDYGFLGEETATQAAAEGEDHVWVVDPNDGTTSMQRGYRGHAVSVGLVRHGVPVLGVVCAVDAPDDDGDLIAWAEGCGPVRRNGQPTAHVAPTRALDAADVVCLSQAAYRNPVGYLPCISPARFVSLPSIAYRLALVATGDYAATVSLNHLSAWDYAAGHALVRGVGGVLLDDTGADIHYAPDGSGMSRRVFGGPREMVSPLVHRVWERAGGSGFGEAGPPPELAPVRARAGELVHDAGMLRRAQGCLLGQVAGDALGALVEFASAETIARSYPDGGPRHLADGGPHRIVAGQPTDDSELALMLARTLVLGSASFNPEAVATAYARWYHGWTHTDPPRVCTHAWCRPFDVGSTTARALRNVTLADVEAGRAATTASQSASSQSQANGALMRISPLGIWGTFRDPSVVAAAARADARLTHPHPICQDASAVFAVTLAAAIRDGLDAYQTYAHAVNWSRTAGVAADVLRAIEAAEQAPPADYATQQGWVLVALQNAFYQLVHAPNLEEAVVATVRAGGDTDTNAGICGALVGAVYGREAVPAQWQRMVLSCRALADHPGIPQPRPALFWPTDALILAERLLMSVHGGP